MTEIPLSQYGVLFDLDGTLVDTAPDLVLALNLALKDHRLNAVTLSEMRHAASHGSMALVRAACPFVDKPLALSLQQSLLHHYVTVNGSRSQLFEGIKAVLAFLDNHGIPFGIVTNKAARFSRPLIRSLGLAIRCQSLISGDSCNRAKPHPDPLRLAAMQIQRCNRQIFYLGDARRDMEAAKNAGMIAVVAGWGYLSTSDEMADWPKDIILKRPEALLSAFNAI